MLWFLRGRRSGRARFVRKSRQNALVPDGCSCGTGNQAQLTIVALVNPGLPNRPADNTRWTAKWTLGFHGIPAGLRACKKQRHEAIKRSWAAVGRRSPWDLVMSMYSMRALSASSNGVGFDTRKTNLPAPPPHPWVIVPKIASSLQGYHPLVHRKKVGGGSRQHRFRNMEKRIGF